jgi:hypothetical protein
VKLWEGCEGTVVADLDQSQFSPDYPKTDWGYLTKGVLIASDKGLIHYLIPEETFQLLARGQGNSPA